MNDKYIIPGVLALLGVTYLVVKNKKTKSAGHKILTKDSLLSNTKIFTVAPDVLNKKGTTTDVLSKKNIIVDVVKKDLPNAEALVEQLDPKELDTLLNKAFDRPIEVNEPVVLKPQILNKVTTYTRGGFHKFRTSQQPVTNRNLVYSKRTPLNKLML